MDDPSKRCGLPHRSIWSRGVASNLREIPGGFVNMTKLSIPAYVSSFLSLGPKFVLPSYGFFTDAAVSEDWRVFHSSLHRYGCSEALYQPLLGLLRCAHSESMGCIAFVSRAEQRILYQANAVEEYLQCHPEIMVVEGDKGKKTGLIDRGEFDKMCLAFLFKGVRSGQYKYHASLHLPTYLDASRKNYMDLIGSYCMDGGCKRLYLPSYDDLTDIADGRNRRVYQVLKRAEWKVPTFIPSVKYHKTPLAIRPVVSKKGSASVSVGIIISEALTLMRYVLAIAFPISSQF